MGDSCAAGAGLTGAGLACLAAAVPSAGAAVADVLVAAGS